MSNAKRLRDALPDDHFITQLGIRRVESESHERAGSEDAAQARSDVLTMEMDCTPQFTNSGGGLQGGLVATLVDVVAGLLALEGLPEGSIPTTSNLAVTYIASIKEGPAELPAGCCAAVGGRPWSRSTSATQATTVLQR